MLFLIASPLNQDSEENHDVVVFLYETFEEPAMQNTSKLVLFVLDIVILKANYRSMVVALLQRFANGPYTVMLCAGDNESVSNPVSCVSDKSSTKANSC